MSFKTLDLHIPRPKTKGVRLISSNLVYAGPAFHVYRNIVKEGSHTGQRDLIRHTGSAVVLAVDHTRSRKDPRVLMVRQYRFAADSYLWELPAGRVDAGESRLQGAKRELLEETGVHARYWKRIFRFYPSPGFLAESMDIFLARGLSFGQAHPEEDENIHIKFFPLNQLVKKVLGGQIHDAKSITGILWLHARTLKGGITHS
ncbi:MAG: NUDIX hydrolase [Acidobacteriales bacterium]|nr:NUDIX hydrolase [Terriglobales bacterium]